MLHGMEQPAPPVPSGYFREIFPASVVLPGQPFTVWHQAKVLLAPEGVYVYRAPSEGPDFAAPANYGASGQPAANLRNGYRLNLADGTLLTITAAGGCGCGSRLRHWKPTWANEVLPWPTMVTQ